MPQTNLLRLLVESRILIIRGLKVSLDSDLAALYQVETKIPNKAVRVETGIVFPTISCFS